MQPDYRTFYDLQPLVPLSEWWHWVAFVGALGLVGWFVIWMYKRDAKQLPSPTAFLLTTLRILAFVYLVVFFLNPQLRSETRFTKTSKLAILVDTSLSMGLKDNLRVGTDSGQSPRRIDEVIQTLKSQPIVETFREQHDVAVYRFGDSVAPEEVASFSKVGPPNGTSPTELNDSETDDVTQARKFLFGALAMAVLSVISLVFSGVLRLRNSDRNRTARFVAVGVISMLLSMILIGITDLSVPELGVGQISGFAEYEPRLVKDPTATEMLDPQGPAATDIDWTQELNPKGTSTRLGSAIQQLVNKERGGPIAGIVIATDGRNNLGTEPSRAIASASNAGIPIFTIGIGSAEAPKNVLVADIQAPPRVLPGDKFQIKGLVQAFGLEGKTIRVDLYSVDEQETEAETYEAETMVRLGADGQSVPVEFEVARQEQGKRRYVVRASAVEGDLDSRDDQRGALVEIVDRKTRVLLMAGGPTREFRFLRNQLYRDKDVVLHVWLQTAKTGADQESDELLQEFPKTREDLYSYDCIIAFDPDWRSLDENQAESIERWVAEKAGGLIVIAGPVNMPEWTRRPRGDQAIDKIRRLYPVSFYSQGSAVLKLGRFGGVKGFPLQFTREGRAAEFLWMGDSSGESLDTWGQFEGVFGYYAVNEAKPGADILANFGDPSTAIDERLPIYLASQFYGAGRVFFQASGEMWRVRRLDVEYFQNYYLKLLRWVSQGRLLRDSTRGVLLTDRERCWMGDQVNIQAILRDSQDEPLTQAAVEAAIVRPDGSTVNVELQGTKDAVRPGTYNGQFSANLEGEYKISLPIPDSPDFEVLTTTVQSNIPDLEKERPQRNDSLLSEIAEKTSGHYYVGMSAFDVNSNDPLAPTQLIQPQDQETLLPGTPDQNFQRSLMIWLLIWIVTTLCTEWTLRRLNKLA